jgi:hypothetical protein
MGIVPPYTAVIQCVISGLAALVNTICLKIP